MRIGTLACILGVVILGSGCANSLITPTKIKGGGDSDQDVLQCSGDCTIQSNDEGWKATTKNDGKLTWITQTQTNAERDVKIVEAAGAIAIEAMAAGAAAASPAP